MNDVLSKITDVSAKDTTANASASLTDAELTTLSTSLVSVAEAFVNTDSDNVGEVADVSFDIVISIFLFCILRLRIEHFTHKALTLPCPLF